MAQFVESKLDDGRCVLRLIGDVDIASADELLAAGRRALENASALEVDFSALAFIDSSGLGSLVRIRNEASEQSKALVLRHLSGATERLFEVTGLDQVFDIES